MDDRADMMADGKPVERLTGKKRFLRGVLYFLVAFAVEFVLAVPGMPEEAGEGLLALLAVSAVICLPGAMVAGGIGMLFQHRRRWHWAVAFVAAAIVTGIVEYWPWQETTICIETSNP